MTEAPTYPAHWEADVVLRDGGTAHLRPIGPDDAELLVEFYEDLHVELYNLKDDVGEKDDRAGQMPEKAEELRKRLHGWRKAVGAQMPTPNPDYKQ